MALQADDMKRRRDETASHNGVTNASWTRQCYTPRPHGYMASVLHLIIDTLLAAPQGLTSAERIPRSTHPT